jgi:hypothetical protein
MNVTLWAVLPVLSSPSIAADVASTSIFPGPRFVDLHLHVDRGSSLLGGVEVKALEIVDRALLE